MPDDELNALRARLLCCCTGYNADEAIRAVTSTLATLIIGRTRDPAAAHDAMNRLAEIMRAHAPHDSRAGARRKKPREGLPAGQRRGLLRRDGWRGHGDRCEPRQPA
jgi:hypothetical protein